MKTNGFKANMLFSLPAKKTRKRRDKFRRNILLTALIALILTTCFYCQTAVVFAASTANSDTIEEQLNNTIDHQMNMLDLEEIEKLFKEIKSGDSGVLANAASFIGKVREILNGDMDSAASFINILLKLFLSEIVSILPLLASISVVAILCGIITTMKSNFLGSNTSEVVFYACYGVVIMMVLLGVWTLVGMTRATIASIEQQMNLALPILLTLMAAVGGTVSAKVYQPAIALLTNGVTQLVANIIIPLFLITLVFAVISNISKNIRITKLTEFFQSAGVWIIGIAFTIFTAFIAVQGLTAASIDSVSIRAAKFATKNYIPILGGYLADGFDLILTSSLLIKNAFGVVGLVMLLSTIVLPAIQIVVFGFGIKFVCSLIEPVTDSRFPQFMSAVAKNMNILLVSILAVAFMYFITVMLLIFSSSSFI